MLTPVLFSNKSPYMCRIHSCLAEKGLRTSNIHNLFVQFFLTLHCIFSLHALVILRDALPKPTARLSTSLTAPPLSKKAGKGGKHPKSVQCHTKTTGKFRGMETCSRCLRPSFWNTWVCSCIRWATPCSPRYWRQRRALRCTKQ